MEDVLEIYHMPYDPDYPLVCMDESCKQMIGEVREPIPCTPGHPVRNDDECVRNGVAEIFMEARRLAERLDIHYTPKHGSWLNMAEIELSVLKGQCLDRRIPDMVTMQTQVAAWEKERNNSAKNIVWQFTTSDVRIKMKRLYPNL